MGLDRAPLNTPVDPAICAKCELNSVPGLKKIFGEIEGRPLLIVHQSPSQEENDAKRLLVGPAGKFVWTALATVGILPETCDVTSALRCMPSEAVKGSYSTNLRPRAPSKPEIDACKQYTKQLVQIAITGQPETEGSGARAILVLGQIAAKQLLVGEYRKNQRIVDSAKLGVRVFCADHPGFFLRGGVRGINENDERLKAFRQTLKAVAEYLGSGSTVLRAEDYLKKQQYFTVKYAVDAWKFARKLKRWAIERNERLSVDVEDDIPDDLSETGAETGEQIMLTVAVCPKPGHSVMFVIDHPSHIPKERDGIVAALKWLLSDPQVLLTKHYGATDAEKLRDLLGIETPGYSFDTFTGMYMAQVGRSSYGLESLVDEHAPQFAGYKSMIAPYVGPPDVPVPNAVTKSNENLYKFYKTKSLVTCPECHLVQFVNPDGEQKKHKDVKCSACKTILTSGFESAMHFRRIPLSVLRLYNNADADVGKRFEQMIRGSVNIALARIYTDMGHLVMRMERNGPLVDLRHIQTLKKIWPPLVQNAAERLRKLAGDQKFNPNTPEDVAWLLWTKLAIPYPDKKAKKLSTGKEILLAVAPDYPIALDIINYRKVAKTMSTYIRGYEYCASLNAGHLRTKFWLCLAHGELVLTNRGYIPVEQVRVDDLVLSHTGLARKVTASGDNGYQKLLRVTLANGMTLTTTCNHPYRIGEDWVAASDLCAGMQATTYGNAEQWALTDTANYEVSSWGRVRTSRGVLRQVDGSGGRLQVNIGGHTRRTHQLVARAFLLGKDELVRHRNGYSWDNTVDNLEYGTTVQNAEDRIRHGHAHKRSLTQSGVDAIRQAPKKWGVQRQLAKQYGLSDCTICDIRQERYRTIPVVGQQSFTKFSTSEIVRVEKVAASHTHALTIDVDGSHITNGIVTHNTGTKTGRLSSGGSKEKIKGVVNLQNIQKHKQIRNILISDNRWRELHLFLKAMIYANCTDAELEQAVLEKFGDMQVFLEFDQGQVEVRVAGQLSGDEALISDCEKGDIHSQVGHAMTGWAIEQIKNDKDVRTRTKNVHFGVLFGLNPEGILRYIRGFDPLSKITLAEVTRYYNNYFNRYPGVRVYIDKQIIFAERNGYVETLFGMQRPLIINEQTKGLFDDYGQPAYWKNIAVNCFDRATEVLTSKGWVPGFSLEVGDVLLSKNPDTGYAEWHPVEQMKKYPDYTGPLVEFKSRSFSAMTTPDHEWLVDQWHSKSGMTKNLVRITRQLRPNNGYKIHRTALYSGASIKTYEDDFIRLCGWFLTDGWGVRPGKRKASTSAYLCQSKPWHVAHIKQLFVRLQYEPRVRVKDGYWTWGMSGDFGRKLNILFPQRTLTPEFLLQLTRPQLKILMRTMLSGDGHRELSVGKTRERISFVCSSQNKADMFQMLCTLLETHCSIKYRDMRKYEGSSVFAKTGQVVRPNGHWVCTVCRRKYADILPGCTINHETSTGGVWCPVVKYHNIFVRRNGHVTISRQTPVQGTAHQLLMCGMVCLIRQPEKYKLLGIPQMEVHDNLVMRVVLRDLIKCYWLAKELLEQEPLRTVEQDFPDIRWKVKLEVDGAAGFRFGAKAGLNNSLTLASFLRDWFAENVKSINELKAMKTV